MSSLFGSRGAFASGQRVEEPKKVPSYSLEVITPKNGRPPHKYDFFLRAGFFLSVICILTGIAMHILEYSMRATDKGFLPKGSMMGPLEKGGMVLVVCGLVACAVFMFTLHDVKAFSMSKKPVVFTQAYFELLHNADWTPAHTKLSAVLTLAITIDIMKPATIGFIMPGLLTEYGLTKTQGAVLPTVAISGTVLGSIIWGFMADRVGRKYSILLSTILFIATSICGAMPSFPTNIFMCWLMGVSVGGLIPVAVSLLSEVVPSRVRSKVLIAMLSIGSALGYLAASGMSYLLQTWFSWRVLWFVGIPTGLIMLPLCNNIPESFRFLVLAQRKEEAIESMELFFGVKISMEQLGEYYQEVDVIPAQTKGETDEEKQGDSNVCDLLGVLPSRERETDEEDFQRLPPTQGPHESVSIVTTLSLSALALAWGFCNYGFLTYIPTMLVTIGKFKQQEAGQLIFYSSAASCAFVPLYIYLYGYCSTRYATIFVAWWEVAMFFIFAFAYDTILTKRLNFCVWFVFLLGPHNAIVAMITVYSAECFATKTRGRGTGIVAAATKVAGVAAPFFITTILSYGKLWQMSVVVGIPLTLGTIVFNIYARETHQHESDSTFLSAVYRPGGSPQGHANDETQDFDTLPQQGVVSTR